MLNLSRGMPLGDGVHTGSCIDLEDHGGGTILASQHPTFQLPLIWWVDSMNPFSITVRGVIQVSFLYYMYGLCLLGALHSKMVLPMAHGAGPATGGAFRLHHFMHRPTEFALFHGRCRWVNKCPGLGLLGGLVLGFFCRNACNSAFWLRLSIRWAVASAARQMSMAIDSVNFFVDISFLLVSTHLTPITIRSLRTESAIQSQNPHDLARVLSSVTKASMVSSSCWLRELKTYIL